MQMYIKDIYEEKDFKLAHGGKAADLYVSNEDYAGVIRAVNDLKEDINRVTKIAPDIKNEISMLSENAVIIGTIGKSPVIDRLVEEGKLDVSDVSGRWECFVIQVISNPVAGVKKGLVIAGSDRRGTIFGIYDLSEQIGVSPWYWWADIPTPHKDTLIVSRGTYKQGEPSVKYRGIFLNDEGPSLIAWVRSNYGDFVHEFYEKIFELILRLKANYLWPAMWDNAFNEDDPLNPVIADMYGIVMGTSHHEPMIRSQREWKINGEGPWNYATNEEALYKFWEYGIERNKNYESIVTLGMRGDGDEPMIGEQTFDEKVQLLLKIVADQRKIIAEKMNPDVTQVPQLWALYKEVLEYDKNGMRVPEDITLLWSDDNHGNIRRAPTAEERKRPGGAGMYYHLDYVGGPRCYKWVNTIPLEKIWEQLHKTYEYGADRIWIINVGDLKPEEMQLEYCLRMAWNIKEFTKDNIWEFYVKWARMQFGSKYAEDIAYIISSYSKFNGRLKPELLNDVELYSLINYKEADTVVAEFHEITSKAEKLYEELPENLKDAFFQLALYPTKGSSQVTELHIRAAQNNLYAAQGRAMTNIVAEMADTLFKADAEITFDYNERMSLGKWNHMMDQTHIGYYFWNQPPRNIMPKVERIEIPAGSEMGVAVEGSAGTWPSENTLCVLPQFSNYTREQHYFEIFNKRSEPFLFSAASDAPWIKLNLAEGVVNKEKRIWVDIDWDTVPQGEDVRGTIQLTSSCGNAASLAVNVFNPAIPNRDSLVGFIEGNGYVSIEAEHYTAKKDINGVGWEKIDNYGRTLASMAIFPVTAQSVIPPENAPCLEYKIYIVNPGDIKVIAMLAPSNDFVPGQRLRLGVSFDDQPPQTVDAIKVREDGGFDDIDWEKSVIYNIRYAETLHHISNAGDHTLKIWMVDPIVVLQKIVVDTGGLKPSYLGPQESYYGGKKILEAPEQDISFDPAVIPGVIQAVHYNAGKNGIAYYSKQRKNVGHIYRKGDIRICDCGDDYIVKDLEKDEWLKYDIFVHDHGSYDLEIALRNGRMENTSIHVECDGKDVSGPIEVAFTGGQDAFGKVQKAGIKLTAGSHVLKLCVDQGMVDLNYFKIDLVQKELLIVKPTLRLYESLSDKPLVTQIGIFYCDASSHKITLTVGLYDGDRLLDSQTSSEKTVRNRWRMLNYYFDKYREVKNYQLKIHIADEKTNHEYCFEMKAPKE